MGSSIGILVDGDIDAGDDGTISGSHVKFDTGVPDVTLFLDGVQVAAATNVGLDPLPVADPSADHYLTFRDLGTDGGGGRALRRALTHRGAAP